MIFLSGHRGNGKSTICDFLSQAGFYVIDTGPFFRNLANKSQSSLTVEKYIELMIAQSLDKYWAENLLMEHIRQIYSHDGEKHLDIIVAGYRHFDDLLYLMDHLKGHIYPNRDFMIWFVQCSFRKAHIRLSNRENRKINPDELRKQFLQENKNGLLKIKNLADVVISNNGKISSLEHKIKRVLSTRDYESAL